jgi:hypothetical protein
MPCGMLDRAGFDEFVELCDRGNPNSEASLVDTEGSSSGRSTTGRAARVRRQSSS